MASDMSIVICYLYPDLMNLYGDRGNVIALARRCAWHGIEARVDHVTLGEVADLPRYDVIFLGGGQDREQRLICKDFSQVKGSALREAVEDGAVVLAVCGGYQLLGRYYRTAGGETLEGTGVLDAWTEAGTRRLIGNVVLESWIGGRKSTVVGFENHSGKTYLGSAVEAFGRVVVGYGNNGEDGTEGAMYRNVLGTYLHGSLLPKNPHLADELIGRALKRKYGMADLRPLDDEIELMAHAAAIRAAKRIS